MGLMILIHTHRHTAHKTNRANRCPDIGTLDCREMSEAPQKSASNVCASCAADLTRDVPIEVVDRLKIQIDPHFQPQMQIPPYAESRQICRKDMHV